MFLDCPVRTVEEVFIHQYVHAPVYVRNDQSYMKNVEDQSVQYFSSNNQSQLKENPNITDSKELSIAEDYDNLTSCIPRYQLVRIKHSQTLSGDYLLRVNIRIWRNIITFANIDANMWLNF